MVNEIANPCGAAGADVEDVARVLVDLRSIHDGCRVAERGFKYFGVGVPDCRPSPR